MKTKYYLLIYILTAFSINSYAQDTPDVKLFSSQMQEHFKFYAKKANHAYQIKNYSEGENLFTDFVNTKLTNTKFTNFKAKKLNGSIINIDQYFSKPLVLITYSSWCIRNEKETKAINDLAKEFHDKIDFVILFWDTQNTARKSSKDFNKHINVLYINERENIFSKEVKNIKYALGFPLTIYLNEDNTIADIRKIAPKYKVSYANIIDSHFKSGLNTLLLSIDVSNEAYAKQ